MPHVSSKKLNDKIWAEVYRQFMVALAHTEPRAKRRKKLHAILTPTERIMLAKRVALIPLISQGSSWYAIKRKLNISPSTITRIAKVIDRGGYQDLLVMYKKQTKNRSWKIIETLLFGIFPQRDGESRRRWVQKMRSGKPIFS